MKASKMLFLLALIISQTVASPIWSIPLSEIDLNWFKERPIEPEWGPDPFVPKIRRDEIKAGSASGLEPFILTAVLLGGERPAAILNGSVVEVGESVKGYRVTKITRKSIFLRGPTGTAEVTLKPLFSLKDR